MKYREMDDAENTSGVFQKIKAAAAVGKQAQKLGAQAGMLFLCALAVLSVYLGLADGAQRLPSPWAYNVGADVFGTVMCALLYYGCFGKEQGEDKSRLLFMSLLVCNACSLFLDQAMWTLAGIATLRVLHTAVYAAFLCVLQLENYQFWRFIRSHLALEGKLARRCDLVMHIVLVPMLLVSLANLFVPICFYVDELGFAHETDAFDIALAYVPILGVCSTLCLLRDKAPLKSKIVIALFYVVPMIFAFLYGDSSDATPPDAPLLAITLMYMVLVAERSRKLASTSAELSMATSIQANMLPNTFPAFPTRKEFDIYATMEPAKEVGGDFYDFFLIDDDHLAMVMADVSGKGVPAALFMMTARTMLKDSALMGLDPAQAFFHVNALIAESNKAGLFVTVWLGILQISTGELTYADAGHEKLLLYQDGAWRFLPKGGCTALAVLEPDEFDDLPDSYRYRNETVQLKPGDMLFQYTDGVTEATDPAQKMFGDERLAAALNEVGGAPPKELLPHVRARIDEFVGTAEQFDDITMLALRYQGGGAE